MVFAKSIFLIPIHFKVTHIQTTALNSQCRGFPNVPKQHAFNNENLWNPSSSKGFWTWPVSCLWICDIYSSQLPCCASASAILGRVTLWLHASWDFFLAYNHGKNESPCKILGHVETLVLTTFPQLSFWTDHLDHVSQPLRLDSFCPVTGGEALLCQHHSKWWVHVAPKVPKGIFLSKYWRYMKILPRYECMSIRCRFAYTAIINEIVHLRCPRRSRHTPAYGSLLPAHPWPKSTPAPRRDAAHPEQLWSQRRRRTPRGALEGYHLQSQLRMTWCHHEAPIVGWAYLSPSPSQHVALQHFFFGVWWQPLVPIRHLMAWVPELGLASAYSECKKAQPMFRSLPLRSKQKACINMQVGQSMHLLEEIQQ